MTSSHIQKYTILLWQDIYANTDWLFSGHSVIEEGTGREIFFDPYEESLMRIDELEGKYYDIIVGIGPKGVCQVQSIIFRTKEGYDRYKEDGVIIFNQPE